MVGRLRIFIRNADLLIVDVKISKNDAVPRGVDISLQHNSDADEAWLTLEGGESKGTQTLFDAVIPFFAALDQGAMIFVDELESSLHPLLAKKIVTQFNDPGTNPRNAQLIFTTHDANLLGSFGDSLLCA